MKEPYGYRSRHSINFYFKEQGQNKIKELGKENETNMQENY